MEPSGDYVSQLAAPATSAARADKGLRAAGYLLDLIPAILIGLLGLIPIVGAMLAGFILAPYWLFRDVGGASLGKRILGIKVVARDGRPASFGSRLLRNVPIALGPSLLVIPFLGLIVGPSVAFVSTVIETIFLFTQGERLGDRWAGTVVLKK